MSQILTWDSLIAKLKAHEEELKSLRYDAFHREAYLGTLHNWIKSDSVYYLLRTASKSPTVVDILDDMYIDMLNLSEKLREADAADINNRNDAFDSQLP